MSAPGMSTALAERLWTSEPRSTERRCPGCGQPRSTHDGYGNQLYRCEVPIHSLALTPAWRQR